MGFPSQLEPNWYAYMSRPSVDAFWKYAHEVISAWEQEVITKYEAAYALIDVIVNSKPKIDDEEGIGDFLSLIAPLDFPEQWDDEAWHEALSIISTH